MSLGKGRLKRDFGGYAQLEAMNVFLVPGVALWFGWPRTLVEVIALAAAIIAVAGLLVIGTIYWRAVDRRLKLKDRATFTRAMVVADRYERASMVAVIGSAVTLVVAFIAVGASRSVIVAAILTLLAALEYVNYYRVQLQVVDNLPDWQRFRATGRFKPAHMARDLAAFRGRS